MESRFVDRRLTIESGLPLNRVSRSRERLRARPNHVEGRLRPPHVS